MCFAAWVLLDLPTKLLILAPPFCHSSLERRVSSERAVSLDKERNDLSRRISGGSGHVHRSSIEDPSRTGHMSQSMLAQESDVAAVRCVEFGAPAQFQGVKQRPCPLKALQWLLTMQHCPLGDHVYVSAARY